MTGISEGKKKIPLEKKTKQKSSKLKPQNWSQNPNELTTIQPLVKGNYFHNYLY